MAFYPFLQKARSMITSSEFSFEDLQDAKLHVIDVVKKTFPPQGAKEKEVKKHALARLLLTVLDDSFSFQSYARNAAQHYKKLLEQNPSDLEEVAREFFPSVEKKEKYEVTLTEFLVSSGKNLADQQLENGKILLTQEQLVDATANAIEQRFLQMPEKPKIIQQNVLETAEELRALLPRQEFDASKFKGKHLELACVQSALKGAPEGKRYYGCMGVAIACVNDKLSKTQAQAVMQSLVQNASKGTSPFTQREAGQVLDWVYAHPTIRFSCRTMQQNGYLDEYCKACKYPYRVRVTE